MNKPSRIIAAQTPTVPTSLRRVHKPSINHHLFLVHVHKAVKFMPEKVSILVILHIFRFALETKQRKSKFSQSSPSPAQWLIADEQLTRSFSIVPNDLHLIKI